MKKIVVYCAIPHHPGVDTIENAEWGFDLDEKEYAHEICGERGSDINFYNEIKNELPHNWKNRLVTPVGGPGPGAITGNFPIEDFKNPQKVLKLIRKFWPKAAKRLEI